MPMHEQDVAALDDVPDGGVLDVEVGQDKVLLIRDGTRIDAIGAVCPHAGAPLAGGIRHDGRIVCPWHKATFCIRTGALLEPPAVDPLKRYEARIKGNRILVAGLERRLPTPPSVPDPRCFVIVGAGAAGAMAAQTLRQTGFAGRVVMVDRENRVPYDRTVLSKYYLSGQQGGEKSPLQSQSFYREQDIERRTGEIVGIDISARRLHGADGSSIPYDAVLLATGSVPRRPTLPGAALRNVFSLRGRADAEAILAQAERSTRAVVLGTSFIGMEVAASLRERGLDVTVVGQETEPFEEKLGAVVGAALRALHERQGVRFCLDRKIERLDGDVEVREVHLADGRRLGADLVVIGFGVEPVIDLAPDLARGAGGGLAVDSTLRAAEGIYVAGDIASFPVFGDGPSIRVEHWRVAQQQGRVAALNMAGQPSLFDTPPVFWTIQYRKRLDYIGHAPTWDDVVIHGNIEALDFHAYYVKAGIVAAAIGMGRDRDTASLAELFRLRHDWTPEALGARPMEVLASLSRP